MIKVGVCGLPRSQKEIFGNLDLVEVQKTFYKPIGLSTAKTWRETAPKGFEFSVKAWQLITHPPSSPTYKKGGLKIEQRKWQNYGFFKPTKEVFEAWEVTKGICEALAAKIVLFQCPPSFKPLKENIENLYDFFASISIRTRAAWEPRGEWPETVIRRICNDLNLIHCVDPFAQSPLTEKLTYLRLHGSPPGKRMYYYTYNEEDLLSLLKKSSSYDQSYVLFNNVTMYDDAVRFSKFVNAQMVQSSQEAPIEGGGGIIPKKQEMRTNNVVYLPRHSPPNAILKIDNYDQNYSKGTTIFRMRR